MDKMKVEGNLGAQRAKESRKCSAKLGTSIPSNPLYYGKPEMAIDEKFGPGDKVC